MRMKRMFWGTAAILLIGFFLAPPASADLIKFGPVTGLYDYGKGSNPETELAWVKSVLKDPNLTLVGKEDSEDHPDWGKSIESYDPGFDWDYAVVKYDGKWVIIEDDDGDNILNTGVFDNEISHVTFIARVPEPSSLLLLGAGLIAVAATARRRRRRGD